MDIRTFNLLEAYLWFSLALVLFVALLRHRGPSPYVHVGTLTSVVFVIFGISDVIEARTGAWWKPFWLLLLKAACMAALAACYFWYRYIRQKRK